MELVDLIEENPGGAVFAGTSVPIRSLFEFLRDDQTLDTFLHNFPSISRYQALAVLSASLNMWEGEPPQSNSDQTQARPPEEPTEAVATSAPNLVCKWCKDPIFAVLGAEYLHAYSGSPECICVGNWANWQSWRPRATPYNDNETYTHYRGRLIADMTKNLVSYSDVDSPQELLELILADARHFADGNRLNFDDHHRRSCQIHLDDIRGTRR